jgi:hypothetical protein
MRRPTLAFTTLLVLSAMLSAPGSAGAQMMMMNMPPPSPTSIFGAGQGPQAPTREQRYMEKLSALRTKTLHLTAQDGGQLTPEHRDSLQKELDALNRQFGIGPARG